ncbi:MAG: cysteine desulfurase family protein [Planctomycetota bacterium]
MSHSENEASETAYLDNNATTPIVDEVVEAMLPWLREGFGNSSSPHRIGVAAARAVEAARLDVADLFGCAPDRVVLTGGGTESIASAIHSARRTRAGRRRYVCSTVEHPASSAPIERFGEEGLEAVRVPVDAEGRLDRDALFAAVDGDTALVSLIWGNNETGVVQSRSLLTEFARHCREMGALLHLDAVQLVGKVELEVEDLGADLVSVSGHKFHAPKGVGALYVRDDADFAPLLLGGSHEARRRAGTVNTAGVVGLGVAARLARLHLADRAATERLRARRDRLERTVLANVEGARVNGAGAERTVNTSNVSFPGVNGNTLLTMLSERNVFVSTGSACGSGRKKASPVLLAMGVDPDLAGSSLRLSLSRLTTDAEVDRGAAAIVESVARIRELAPTSA